MFKFFGVMPRVPIQFRYGGDYAKATAYKGLGMTQMGILSDKMAFQNLKTDVREIQLDNGTIIQCTKNYTSSVVEIYTPIATEIFVRKVDVPIVSYKYYYRIENEVVGSEIDRIIVWALLKDENTSSEINERIIPGTGFIVLDVDVENSIIYPTDIVRSPEEIAATLALAQEYIAQIDGGGAPVDKAIAWFSSGALINPVDEFVGSHGRVELTLEDAYDSVYHMVGYSSYNWPGLSTNYDNYGTDGNFWYSPDTSHEPATTICGYGECNEATDIREVYNGLNCACFDTPGDQSPWTGTDNALQAITDGTFYTEHSAATDISFPCFFMCVSDVDGTWVVWKANKGVVKCDYSYVSTWVTGYELWSHSVEAFMCDETSMLYTPVEALSGEDIMLYMDDSIGDCPDTDCYSLGPWMKMVFEYTGNTIDQSYFPCDPLVTHPTAGPNRIPGMIKKETANAYADFDSSLHIPDPEAFSDAPADAVQVNLVSLRQHLDLTYGVKSGWSTSYYDLNTDDWYCDGVHYGYFVNLPGSTVKKVGTVIYIFNPESFWTENESTGDKENFWDIHSERVSATIINPYRVLALEEYINNMLMDYKESVYGVLTNYGYEITDGFIY